MPVIDLGALGGRIRRARLARGLTQAGLAELSDITDETVSRLERGAFEPSLSTLVAVARALDATLEELLGAGLVLRERQRTYAATLPTSLRALVEAAGGLDAPALGLLLRFARLLEEAGEQRRRR